MSHKHLSRNQIWELPPGFSLHDWSQPHLPWRIIFHNIDMSGARAKAKSHTLTRPDGSVVNFTSIFLIAHEAWREFSEHQIAPLCREEISIRGTPTVYFASKEDVSRVMLLLATQVQGVQHIDDFRAYGGRVVPVRHG